MASVLENIVWNTLSGRQKQFATGEGTVRRYAKGFSAIVGFADQSRPDFDELAKWCDVGESFYCEGVTAQVPTNWNIQIDSFMFKMVFNGSEFPGEDASDAVDLGSEHAERAVELAKLTNPGPFGLRTIELGDYYGYFDGDQLIAMAGERFDAGEFREISAVCTHPDYQGRGLAKKLMSRLIRQEVLRGQTPFLHVMSHNEVARALYRKLGFVDYHETPVRLMTRIH